MAQCTCTGLKPCKGSELNDQWTKRMNVEGIIGYGGYEMKLSQRRRKGNFVNVIHELKDFFVLTSTKP